MAGYSQTPLVRKLGIKPGMNVVFVRPPDGYRKSLGTLPDDIRVGSRLSGRADFVHAFCDKARDLDSVLPRIKKVLAKDGLAWLSWPKKSSGVVTDIDEGRVRRAGLDAGLVDVKICAVDDTWSGLKFVYRRKDR